MIVPVRRAVARVPYVNDHYCLAECPDSRPDSPHGYVCTRQTGHTGRHAAGGPCQSDGNREIYWVWS